MSWIDLLIISFLLWGGVAGSLTGFQRMGHRIGALLSAVAISSCFKREVQLMLERTYPVSAYVRERVNQRFALAVVGQGLEADSSMPPLLEQLYPLPVEAGRGAWLELISSAISNIVYFVLALMIWGFICRVIFSLGEKHSPGALSRLEQLGGIGIGIGGAVLSAALVLGVTVPLSLLLTFDLFNIEHAALFQLIWNLVGYLGIGWS